MTKQEEKEVEWPESLKWLADLQEQLPKRYLHGSPNKVEEGDIPIEREVTDPFLRRLFGVYFWLQDQLDEENKRHEADHLTEGCGKNCITYGLKMSQLNHRAETIFNLGLATLAEIMDLPPATYCICNGWQIIMFPEPEESEEDNQPEPDSAGGTTEPSNPQTVH